MRQLTLPDGFAPKPINRLINTVKVLIHGNSGAGKTFLSRSLPQASTFYVGTEGKRTHSLKGYVFAHETLVTCWQDFIDNITWLSKNAIEKGIKTVYIDSITELSVMCIRDIVAQKSGIIDDGSIGIQIDLNDMSIKDWGTHKSRMEEQIRRLRDLDINLIATALTSIKDDFEGGQSVKFPQVDGKQLAMRLPTFFDFVFYIFSKGVQENAERVIQTDQSETTLCKGHPGLPFRVEANLTKIIKQILNFDYDKKKSDGEE